LSEKARREASPRRSSNAGLVDALHEARDRIADEGGSMLSREDFVFTIGYDGAAAIVDGRARRQYGKLSTMELAEEGLYRAAFASAFFDREKDAGPMMEFIRFFNAKAGTSYTKAEELQRLFGVNMEDVTRTIVL
jgi:hypothetical protein